MKQTELRELSYPENLDDGNALEEQLRDISDPLLRLLLIAKVLRESESENEALILDEVSGVVDFIQTAILADSKLGFTESNTTTEVGTRITSGGILLFLLKISVEGDKKLLYANNERHSRLEKLVRSLIVRYFEQKGLKAVTWGGGLSYIDGKSTHERAFFIAGPSQEMVPKVGKGTVLGSGAIGG